MQFIIIIGILIFSSNSFVSLQETSAQSTDHELRILKENDFIKGIHPVSPAVCYMDDPTDPIDCQTYNSYLATYLFVYDDDKQEYTPNYNIIEAFSHTTNLANFVFKIIFKDGLQWSDGQDFHASEDVLNTWDAYLDNTTNTHESISDITYKYFAGGNNLQDSLAYKISSINVNKGFQIKIPLNRVYDVNLEAYNVNFLRYSVYKDLAQLPILPSGIRVGQGNDVDFSVLDYYEASLSPYRSQSFSNVKGSEFINIIRNPNTLNIYTDITFNSIKIVQMSLEDALEEAKDDSLYTILSSDYQIYNDNLTSHTNYNVQNLDKNYMLGFSELFDGHIRNHVIGQFTHYTHDDDVSNATFIEGFKKAFDLSINKTLLAEQLNGIDDPNYYYKELGSLFNVETDVFYNSNISSNQFNVTKAREIFTSIGFDYDSLESSSDLYLGDLGILINNDYFSDDNVLAETVLSQLRGNLNISFTTIYDTSDLPNHFDKWEFFGDSSKLHNVIDDFYFVTVNVFRAESYNFFQVKNFYNPESLDDNPYNNNLFNQELKDAFINYTDKGNYRNDFLEGAKATMIIADLKHRQNIGLVSNTNSILVDNSLTNFNANLLSMNVYNYDIDLKNKSSSSGDGGGSGGGGGSGSGGDSNTGAIILIGGIVMFASIIFFSKKS